MNEYVKQYPDLMKGKKVMYVHGFASSAKSGTVTRLRELLPSAEIVAEDIPIDPHEGLRMLKDLAEKEQPDLIIGTSMGGMYAEQLYGFDRILINPAFQIADTMGEHGMMGKQTFLNPRKDGVQEFIMTKALCKEYRAVQEECFLFGGERREEREYLTRNRSACGDSLATKTRSCIPRSCLSSTTRRAYPSTASIA